MRILFLSARVPYPLDTGSKIRTFHLLRGLARRHEVTLLTFAAAPGELPAPVAEACAAAHVVTNREIDGLHPSLLPLSLARRTPYTVLKYRHPELRQRMLDLSAGRRFDLIHCDHLHMGQHLDALPATPAILDEHNIESSIWAQVVDDASPLARPLYEVQRRLMLAYERAVCEHARLVITCSEEDRRWVLEKTAQRWAEVVPNGVDISYFTPRGSAYEEPDTLVFVGSMDWLPNRAGILRFHERVWPRLRERLPSVRMVVVGRNPDAQVRALAGEGFEITGTVDDVRPYVHRAALYVVPLYLGGGTRLKILEAFAMEKCVVSTALGAEGIAYTDGEDIAIAADDASFVAQIERLLADRAEARRLGRNARALATARYGWDAIAAGLGEHLSRLG